MITNISQKENLSLTCFRVWNSLLSENFPVQEIIDELKGGLKALKEKDEDTLAEVVDLHMQKTQESLKNLIF